MALLGAQLVITLVMVSVIQKLSPHYSLAKWLLCSTNLIRYLHPTDTDLRILAGVPKNINKSKRDRHKNFHNNNNNADDIKSNTFHIPRNLDIQLETIKVMPMDVVHLRYYTEYQWLVDFSLYASIVYVLSEVYHYYFPLKEEINLSMMWCLLVIFFSFKLLISLTVQYFQSDESIGERSTCLVLGLVYLLIAMIILIIDENTLEIGLEKAYSSFNESATIFLEGHGVNTSSSSGPASKIIVKFSIAVCCGVLGAIFTFPGLRMARMHWDSLKYCEENLMRKILLNISFVFPFLLVLLWIRPISRDYLTTKVFSGMQEPLLTSNGFDTIRLILIIVAVVLRFALMPIYLQAYLNIAYDRVQEQKKEAGRITNIELQKKIASIFYYLCVVTLQYVAPLIMCLYFALMYKTLGDYKWMDIFGGQSTSTVSIYNDSAVVMDDMQQQAWQQQQQQQQQQQSESLFNSEDDSNILVSAENVQLTLQSLKAVFTTDVYRGILGFATWWSCFVLFAASSLGLIYQTYFTKK